MKIAAFLCGIVTLAALEAAAQAPDTSAARRARRGAAFDGSIASVKTTLPVELADVRLIYVDSAHVDKTGSRGLEDIFVDSAKSRVAMSDEHGNFTIRNVSAGHYMINVRRIGFEPIEALVTIDTNAVHMDLAMTQIATVLPPVRIYGAANTRVEMKLKRVGFEDRRHMASGNFLRREDIMRQQPQYITDVLRKYGIGPDAIIDVDRMPADWDYLRSLPPELVVGLEIYRRRFSLPTELGTTRGGTLVMASGGRPESPHVMVWTFIP